MYTLPMFDLASTTSAIGRRNSIMADFWTCDTVEIGQIMKPRTVNRNNESNGGRIPRPANRQIGTFGANPKASLKTRE